MRFHISSLSSLILHEFVAYPLIILELNTHLIKERRQMNKNLNTSQQANNDNLAFVPFTEEVLHKLSDAQAMPKATCPALVPFDLKYGTIEILVENQWVTVVPVEKAAVEKVPLEKVPAEKVAA